MGNPSCFNLPSRHTTDFSTTTDRQIPSILSYVDGEEYYGQQAKSFLVRNPSNTIAYFRDFLGQEYA